MIFELIQDYDTNFVLYDGTDRSDDDTDIEFANITQLKTIFKSTSTFLEEDKTYFMLADKTALHKGVSDFTGYNWYDREENLTLILNGSTVSIDFDSYLEAASDLFFYIQAAIDSVISGFTVSLNGSSLNIQSNVGGESQTIEIQSSPVLKRIGWVAGIYRGTDIDFITTNQSSFNVYYYPQDLGFTEGAMPQGTWDVRIEVSYGTGEIYTYEFSELSFKQLELYRAKRFEQLAKENIDISIHNDKIQTEESKDLFNLLMFDVKYRSMKAACNINNYNSALTTLNYLIDIQELNPLTNE